MNRKFARLNRGTARAKPLARYGVLVFGLVLAGCATRPAGTDDIPRLAPDPLEPFNRTMLHVNDGLETVIAKPIDTVYRAALPSDVRKGFANAADNLRSPVTFANDILQGKPKRAAQTLARFLLNSTVGLAGLIDVASAAGIKVHYEDFGQTLGVWGIKNGPYLVLPVFGPTTVRDGVGLGVDAVTDPTFWLIHDTATSYALYGMTELIDYDNHRDDLDTLRKSSIDFYSALRSAYLQSRDSDVHDGAPSRGYLPDILDSDPDALPPPQQ